MTAFGNSFLKKFYIVNSNNSFFYSNLDSDKSDIFLQLNQF